MCGIAGLWTQSSQANIDDFNEMLGSLAMRGPDGSGVEVLDEGRLLLGHRRLSIIDLSEAGRQPMPNEDATIWLTFNGEIYNFRTLRQELEKLGHVFHSQTDSEAIVHAYEEWGADCVKRLRGIFAFAIYDSREKALFLARDHVGVKPLYYHVQPGRFIFGSLARVILLAPGFRRSIDQSAFRLFLAYGNVPGSACIFEGIRKLPPGHWLYLKDEKLQLRQYWKLRYLPLIKDQVEAVTLVRSKVLEAIRIQLLSDVPIGTLLSGGIDSTIITSSALHQGCNNLSTFNIGFDEESSDESHFAQLVAEYYQTNHHTYRLTYEAACDDLRGIVDALDEPFDLNGLFPYYRLAKFVRAHGVKVALGGDGADEVFGGYLWYEAFQREILCEKKSLSSMMLNWLTFGLIRSQVAGSHLFFTYNGYFNNQQQSDWLGLPHGRDEKDDIFRILDMYWDPEKPIVLAAQFMDFNCFLVDHCLTKVDRTSMAHGLEVRVPFLDVDLLESVFSIDHSLVFHEGRRKAILKQAMADCLPVGMEIERKKGFSSPIKEWLTRGLGVAGEAFVVDGALVGTGLLQTQHLAKSYTQFGPRLQMALLSAELWCRRWIHGDTSMATQLSAAFLQSTARSIH